MNLLKELVSFKLIEPSWISIEKTNEDSYQLKIKCTQDISTMKKFCDDNRLAMEEQDGSCVISSS